MIAGFVLPCTLSLLIMYLYPVIRTIVMSFFAIDSVTASVSEWSFNGLGNYARIFGSATYLTSLSNMLKIWFVGGILTLTIALLFAVILTSGIRFKKFFRAAIYLPNVISAVALATMWIQYVYNQDYGLLNAMLEMVGLDGVRWLGTDMKFWAMLFAFVFGAVGYYMLIFISGIERIPQDLYEAATIDGANKIQQFFKITLPLLKGIIKTNLTFWSVNTITFFLWSKMFSPVSSEASTIVPVVYLYDTVFGSTGNTERDAGAGAGNPPALVDETADIRKAAEDIVNGCTFDNNLPCIAEKEIVAVDSVVDELMNYMINEQGCYLISKEEQDALTAVVLKDGKLNRKCVGRDAKTLLGMIGITVPDNIRCITFEGTKEHPLIATELMMPILGVVRAKDFDDAVEQAVWLEHGNRHSAHIHSKNVDNITKYAKAIDTAILVKNGPSYAALGFGGEGFCTFTIASRTGEGLTSASTFTKRRRCVMTDSLCIR